jgi:hypothetical protein
MSTQKFFAGQIDQVLCNKGVNIFLTQRQKHLLFLLPLMELHCSSSPSTNIHQQFSFLTAEYSLCSRNYVGIRDLKKMKHRPLVLDLQSLSSQSDLSR